MKIHQMRIGIVLLFISACSAPPHTEEVHDSISIQPVQNVALSQKQEEQQEKREGRPIIAGQSFTLPSMVMGEDREINVWTPPEYKHTDKSYSVLYVLDGGIEQDFPHISGLAQLGAMNWNYEKLIVVGVKSGIRLNELAHTPTDVRYINAEPERQGQSHIFSEYLRTEILPYVEKNYRTGPRRAVMGESLAGLFVTELFLKHPDSFTDYVAISPSLWWDDKNLIKSAPNLLTQHANTAKPPYIERHLYLTMADEGGTMQGGLDMLMAALKAHPPKGLKWHYVDRRESETHSTIYHGAALDALDYLFDLPAPDYGPDPWYLVEGGQPPMDTEADK